MSSVFNDIPPHEAPLQASSSPLTRIRKVYRHFTLSYNKIFTTSLTGQKNKCV